MLKAVRTIVMSSAISLAVVTQAQALNTRTWISGKGTDTAGCGPIATPCRTLQFAHDQTNSGGEIDILDPAGYGSIVITKAISVVSDGALAGVLAAPGANAINVNAGPSDAVMLKGLTIEGGGSGLNGVAFNSGGSLVVIGCLVRGFVGGGSTGNGFILQPQSGTPNIAITDTTVSNNASSGISYYPLSGSAAATLTVERVTTGFGRYGIVLNTYGITGSVKANISNASASNHSDAALAAVATATTLFATVDQVNFSNNRVGIQAISNSVIYLGRSVIAGNVTGISFDSSPTVYSFGDNRIVRNGADTSGGTLTTAVPR